MYPTLKVTRKKVECFNEGNFYVTELTANEVKEYNLRQKQREEDEDNLESAYDLIVLGLVKGTARRFTLKKPAPRSRIGLSASFSLYQSKSERLTV